MAGVEFVSPSNPGAEYNHAVIVLNVSSFNTVSSSSYLKNVASMWLRHVLRRVCIHAGEAVRDSAERESGVIIIANTCNTEKTKSVLTSSQRSRMLCKLDELVRVVTGDGGSGIMTILMNWRRRI